MNQTIDLSLQDCKCQFLVFDFLLSVLNIVTGKQHSYGVNGEHAHDYSYSDDGKVKRTTREMTVEERRENEDIL